MGELCFPGIFQKSKLGQGLWAESTQPRPPNSQFGPLLLRNVTSQALLTQSKAKLPSISPLFSKFHKISTMVFARTQEEKKNCLINSHTKEFQVQKKNKCWGIYTCASNGKMCPLIRLRTTDKLSL